MPIALVGVPRDQWVLQCALAQAQAHPERRELLERWLDRAETRARFMLDEIQTTGDRLLSTLDETETAADAAE